MAKEVIIVTDVDGSPIAGAEVVPMSYSINMKSVFTNSSGEAFLKSNIQGLKWVNIEKRGYEASHIQITGEWPLYVQLPKNSHL
jgi:hypothetical protein